MVTLVGVQQTSAARILMAVPISTRSHDNFFIPIAENLAKRNHTVSCGTSQESECRALQLCPEDMLSLHELRINSSLFITNSVRTMENPTLPYTPMVVHAGGLHCRPAKPLPQDLQQWLSEAGPPGFILFSLGTVVKSSTMPDKYKKVLVDVFGSLEQRVLWKWDEVTMDGLPSNVRLSQWLPQQDILAHLELRLFITHGGLFSTQEASYHGVSILGIPVSIDQHHNMRMVPVVQRGRVGAAGGCDYSDFRSVLLAFL
ncbi:UDP-glucuronosyltransferase 2B20 [Chionoecetes opilio]|uniref:UDP-glucuronosyltransferase 2B20 n=1 Tax=Chionoecetes opilio TaxID=41210 RepID=A0A8J5CU14_CHIOP|nr:UDP-glucuronosyltransferase 2B20 [Chionoecetes opilio]